jgi:fibronectin-binding autotransporter adhesin
MGTSALGNTAGGTPFATGVDGFVYPQFIGYAQRAPTSQDIENPGTRWQDNSVNPAVIYETTGAGLWLTGGDNPATTSTFGIVRLATLTQLQNGNAPAGAYVPTSNDVATVVAAVVAGAGVPATTAQQGYVYLETDANAVLGTSPNPNTALQPSNLAAVFAAPPVLGFGSTTPRPVAASTLSASGATALSTSLTVGTTLGVTGASTIAALSATSGAFSTTLAVTGASTLAALSATSGTFSTTLGVTGASTLAALSATSGTFSTTLGVTGASTFTSGTFSTTLGVTGLASLTTLAVSSTSTFTGLATFNGGTTIASGTLTTGALTVVGTALINNSGAAATTIGGASAGAIGIVVGSGGNFTMSTATAGATMAFGSASQTGAMTFGASTAGQTVNISSASTIAGTNVVNLLAGATPGASQTFNLMTGVGTAGTYAVNVLTGNSTGTTQSLSLATGLAATTIAIGNVTSTTGMTLSVGTNNLLVNGAVTSTYTIGTALGTGLISLGLSTAGQTVAINNAASNTVANVVNILNGATPGANNTLNIMNGAGTAGTQTVNILASGATRAGAINLGTGIAAHVVTIGQVTSSLVVNAPQVNTLASGAAVGITVNTSAGTGRGVSVTSSGVSVPDYASLAGGILVTPTDVAAGASPQVAANRHFKVVFNGVSIAANADQTLTITNSVITGANTDIMITWSGTTTGSAVSLKSVVPGAGTVALTFTNGVGATTTTSNITIVGWVIN